MSNVNQKIMGDSLVTQILDATVAKELSVSESCRDDLRMNRCDLIEALKEGFRRQDDREKELFKHLSDILNSARTFVDIGASLGIYTYHVNNHIHAGRIFAIEPEPVRFGELKKRCMKWQSLSDNQLIALNLAIADQDGKTSFHRATNIAVSGALYKHRTALPEEQRKSLRWEEITVDCVTLDTLFDKSPEFVKIDVEGSELRVLRGAQRILKEGKARFLIEVHPWSDTKGIRNSEDVYDFMERFGYRTTEFYGQKLFMRSRYLRLKNRLKSILRGFRILRYIKSLGGIK